MKPEILVNFYRSIIESILNRVDNGMVCNMTDADRNSLSRVIRTARRLTVVDLPDLREIFYCRVKSRIHKVIADPSHPPFTFFELLPSGKRYRSLGYTVGPVLFRFKKSNFPFQKKLISVSIPFHYWQR